MKAEELSRAARLIGEKLNASQRIVCTAESCTGGLIAAHLTDIPGSSAWFDCGLVTYSNTAKTQLLGVDANLIETYGAVSKEVAEAMALGALANSHADIAVAVTGIAGPDGGSADKPVGTVYIAWASGERIISNRYQFNGTRADIRQQTVLQALTGVLQLLD